MIFSVKFRVASVQASLVLDDDGPLFAMAHSAADNSSGAAPLVGPHPLVVGLLAVPLLGLAAGLQDAAVLLVPPAGGHLVVAARLPAGAQPLAAGGADDALADARGTLAHAAGAKDVAAPGHTGLADGLQAIVPAAAVLLPEAASAQLGAGVGRLVPDAHALAAGRHLVAAPGAGTAVAIGLAVGDGQDDEQEN